jgi:hypothetical protein
MNYKEQITNRITFLSLTGLHPEEFDYLLSFFTPLWDGYYRHYTTEGIKRKILSNKEHKSAKLQGTGQKLFFLLVFLKTNSLQSFQGASFGISQSKVSKISVILLNILDQTLKKMSLTPSRNGQELQHLLKDHADKIFTYDGTERGIERNTAQDAQEIDYSGKKKAIA